MLLPRQANGADAVEQAIARAVAVTSSDPAVVFRADDDGGYRHIFVAPAIAAQHGLIASQIEGRTVREVYHPTLAARFEERARNVLSGTMPVRYETRSRTLAGPVTIEFTMAPIIVGTARYLTVLIRDLAARDARFAALTASDERLRVLLEHSPDMVFLVDRAGIITHATPAVHRILGHEPEDLVGTNSAELIHPDDKNELVSFIGEVMRLRGVALTAQFRIRHRNGSTRHTECAMTNLLDDPRVGAVVVNASDISEHQRITDELAYRAHHDDLTGLPNRRLILQRLEALVAQTLTPGRTAAALFVDIDGFKIVNDSRGHAAGDELLRRVADRLREAVRDRGIIGRVGGDEFVIVPRAPGTVADHLLLAEEIRAAIAVPFEVAGAPHFLSASVGVATGSSASGSPAHDLLVEADLAMYAAKRQRDAIRLYDESMRARARRRLETATDLRHLLDRHELELHYQPVRRVATGRVASVEGLLRWHHPTRGLIMPDDFIAIAEEMGAIVPIGDWVIATMCAQLAAWNAQGRRIAGAVNVSPLQIVDPGFLERTSAAVAAAGIQPRQLVLELTEGSIMEDSAHIRDVLEGLTRTGMRIAIDDFGRGFSSLSYLNQLPAAILKIDRSFTSGLGRPDADDGHVNLGRIGGADPITLFRSIVAMAHSLGLDVVAEGVETEAQLAIVRSTGCAFAQGYLLGRPAPRELVDPVVLEMPTAPPSPYSRSGMFFGMNSGQAMPSTSRILPLTHEAAGDAK